MYRISHHPLVKHLALVVAVLMIAPYGFLAPAAHGQAFAEITSAVVVPIQDATGYGSDLLSQKATDAVAMALVDSGEFRTEAKRTVAEALDELGLVSPFMDTQLVRLGKHLEAEKVIAGTVLEAKVNPKTGQCLVRLEIRMMDVELGYVFNGALAEVETPPLPGWQGSVSVVNEALRQVAEKAVREMLRRRVPRGSVDAVDTLGVIILNIGLNDNVYDGQMMLVARPDWNPDMQEVKVRAVGEIQVYDAQPRLSKAKTVGVSGWPQTGDKVYALYSGAEVAQTRQRKRSITKSLRLGAAALMLLGVVWIGKSKGTTGPPGANVHIAQEGAGGTPFIRVNLHRGFIPDVSQVHAWMFFRGSARGMLATPDNLVAATSEARMYSWDDTPEAGPTMLLEKGFSYFDRTGAEAEGTISIERTDPALVPSDTYYYRVRRIVDPIFPVIPLAAQVQPAAGSWSVEPTEAVGEASRAVGPVTYFEPAILNLPANNSMNENPADVTFEWTPSVGADQYRVEVYNNQGLSGGPVYQSQRLSWTGQTIMTHKVAGYSFGGSTTYWWIVGNRVNPAWGEPLPLSYLAGQSREGWIYSSPFAFTTVEGPPEPWVINAQSDRPSRPATRRGRMHERLRGFSGPQP